MGVVALVMLSAPFWGPLLMRRMAFFRVRRVEIRWSALCCARVTFSRGCTSIRWLRSGIRPRPLVARSRHAIPRLQSAVVRRKLPGTLVVEVVERVPVALVPAAGGFRVYDARGVALPIDPARSVTWMRPC